LDTPLVRLWIQETLVNLAALLANLWLLGAVDGKHRLIWTLFVGTTGFRGGFQEF
jgi:hypothetical protein